MCLICYGEVRSLVCLFKASTSTVVLRQWGFYSLYHSVPSCSSWLTICGRWIFKASLQSCHYRKCVQSLHCTWVCPSLTTVCSRKATPLVKHQCISELYSKMWLTPFLEPISLLTDDYAYHELKVRFLWTFSIRILHIKAWAYSQGATCCWLIK